MFKKSRKVTLRYLEILLFGFIHYLFVFLFIQVFSTVTDLVTSFPTTNIGFIFVLKLGLNLFLVTSGSTIVTEGCRTKN